MVGQDNSITKINDSAWDKLKKQIEYHLKQDSNLTDIRINYQVKVPQRGTRNYLGLSVTINKEL
jgi:hypothetical protein|tara:strand:+ start:215 stop:406 length:192 start_codon:yes stop_codon:yes gene_type:complete